MYYKTALLVTVYVLCEKCSLGEFLAFYALHNILLKHKNKNLKISNNADTYLFDV